MIYEELIEIVEVEFADLVLHCRVVTGKLRIYMIDGSYMDVWFSRKLKQRFAYHWERRSVDGTVYRYDNRPHESLRYMKGYPKHFHNGSDENIVESSFSGEPGQVLRSFLQFCRIKIRS